MEVAAVDDTVETAPRFRGEVEHSLQRPVVESDVALGDGEVEYQR